MSNSLPAPPPAERIAPDTWLVTELMDGPPGAHVPVRSMVISGREPVIVDTGISLRRHRWLETTFALVDPADVRWIVVSHDDHDHVGNLEWAMAHCPNATLVGHWFAVERLAGDLPLPAHRMMWVNDGESLDVGDRILRFVRPAVYDSPTTRGVFDPRSSVYWASDAFASMVTAEVGEATDLDGSFWEESFLEMNRQIAPWTALVDPTRFGEQVARTAALGADVVVGAHGAVLRGGLIERAHELMARLPGLPEVRFPGQSLLDEQLAAPPAA